MRHSVARTITLASILLALTISFGERLHAQTFTVLHTFTGGSDGANPEAGLSMDAAGNLYGTASVGGYFGGNCSYSGGCGVVFKLSRRNSAWLLTPLYRFQGGSDGAFPIARVVIGPNGSLYGTTYGGGQSGDYHGTVFNLKPPAHAASNALDTWIKTTLYTFMGGSDGGRPAYGDIIFDAEGNILGTTALGGDLSCGSGGGCGTVFKLMPSGSGWTETVLYSFTGQSDGGYPEGGVILDGLGNLYSTTEDYGAYPPCGTVFQLVPSGSGWAEHTLHAFGLGDDGCSPYAGLTLDASYLLGTTLLGGSQQAGTVFALTTNGGSYSASPFPGPPQFGPSAGVSLDASGHVYGTTLEGGASGYGSVFKDVQTSLHSFTGGSDGKYPVSNVIFDGAGNLYGTAGQGGAYGYGVVWEITP